MEIKDDRIYQKGYFPNLVEKSKPLEIATSLALMKLKLPFDDLTRVYNGNFMTEHYGCVCGYTPDFVAVIDSAIEVKAWDTSYRVSRKMIEDKVVKRFEGNKWKYKIVIFSEKPNFQNGIESYLLSTSIKPIYVGFRVTWYNLRKAIGIIKSRIKNILGVRVSHIMSGVNKLKYWTKDKRIVFRVENHKEKIKGTKRLFFNFIFRCRNITSELKRRLVDKIISKLDSSLHYRVWSPDFLEHRLNPTTEYLTNQCNLHHASGDKSSEMDAIQS